MKKILAIVLALAMILSLAACGSKAEETKPAESVKTTEAAKTETVKEEKEPVTLEFLCWGAAEETTADAFKAMLDGFMEKYPWITVEVTESNYDAVNTSLLTRIAAQDAPDVAQVSNQWVATYYEMGGLLPLDEYMSAETLADFYPGTMSGTNIDGHQYSATWITQPFALYCNSDLLAAAGYDHTPTTWDELIEMSYAVAALGKNADGNTVYGRTLGTKVLANAGYMSLIDVWANGGDYYAEDGTIAYGDEATVAALTEMQKEIQEGVIAAGNQIVDKPYSVRQRSGGVPHRRSLPAEELDRGQCYHLSDPRLLLLLLRPSHHCFRQHRAPRGVRAVHRLHDRYRGDGEVHLLHRRHARPYLRGGSGLLQEPERQHERFL